MRRLTESLPLVAAVVAGLLVPTASRAQTATTAASMQKSHPSTTASVAGLQAQLRQLVTAEESYFKKHGAYTTDLAALHLWDSNPKAASWVQVIYAGGRSWSARAVLSGTAKKSCVIFVGSLKDSPQPPRTEVSHAAPVAEGEPRCDK